MAKRLRQADRDEIAALYGADPLDALRKTVAGAEKAFEGRINGRLAVVYGVRRVSPLSTVGLPWMLGTDVVEKHPLPFLRASRQGLAEFRKGFTAFWNVVSAENTLTIQWLKWMGFEFGPAFEFNGARAHRFEMRFP